MHVSPDTVKTVAFVLLMLLVALYMHLAQAPRREPQSLVDIARHRPDQGPAARAARATTPKATAPKATAPKATTPKARAPRARAPKAAPAQEAER